LRGKNEAPPTNKCGRTVAEIVQSSVSRKLSWQHDDMTVTTRYLTRTCSPGVAGGRIIVMMMMMVM